VDDLPTGAPKAMHPPHRTPAFAVPIVLFAIAILLWTNPLPFTSPAAPAATIPAWVPDVTPIRQPTLKPEIVIGGFTYRCSDCHRLIESPPETTRTLTQHTHIVLNHGRNTRCFNCHNRTNRDVYVDDWGREIPADQPQLVCAKCHGPVYRDWLHGSHGRTNGFWNREAGPIQRRKCIECHDPHRPPFPPMHPAPPPDTLRMGDQSLPLDAGESRDPLRIYRKSRLNPNESSPNSP
jgi:hypothetical protein